MAAGPVRLHHRPAPRSRPSRPYRRPPASDRVSQSRLTWPALLRSGRCSAPRWSRSGRRRRRRHSAPWPRPLSRLVYSLANVRGGGANAAAMAAAAPGASTSRSPRSTKLATPPVALTADDPAGRGKPGAKGAVLRRRMGRIGPFRSRDEAVTTAGDRDDDPWAAVAYPVAQGAPQRDHVIAHGCFDDHGVGPDAVQELLLADDLARPADQDAKDIERAAGEVNPCPLTLEPPLVREKFEVHEPDR